MTLQRSAAAIYSCMGDKTKTIRAACNLGACLSRQLCQILRQADLQDSPGISNFWHAELILAAKEQNKSAHSSGRKNAMQMLLEAKDEDGAMVREACLQLFPFYKDSSMLVL